MLTSHCQGIYLESIEKHHQSINVAAYPLLLKYQITTLVSLLSYACERFISCLVDIGVETEEALKTNITV